MHASANAPAIFASAAAYAVDLNYLVFVGTYTGEGSQGIYAYRFHPGTGKLTSIGLAVETVNPSFLAAAPSGRFLYAVNELDTFNGQPTGAVSAFEIARESGKLRFLQQVSSLGAAPAHLSLDRTGRYVLIANYNSGNVAVFPIGDDGKLGPHSAFEQQVGSSINPQRQTGPHAHSILTSNDNRFALSADLGTDQVFVYRFDAQNGSLSPNDPAFARVKAGSGPRQIAFAPSGKWVYLANEMAATITVFAYDTQSGTLKTKQTVLTLPEGFKGENREAEIVVDAKGTFLYVSNRGDDSITVFHTDGKDGRLSFVQRVRSGGKIPRNFAIDPTGQWLVAANRQSNNIQLFRVNSDTGQLTAVSQISGIFDPVCVIFVPSK
jgi:6-phosphogluconolactonase